MVLSYDNNGRLAFAARIREAAKRANLPSRGLAALLARETGVTNKAAQKWLNGDSTPSNERVIKIAALLRVDLPWLVWGSGEPVAMPAVMEEQEAIPGVLPVSVFDEALPPEEDEVEVPFFEEVELSGGLGRTAVEVSESQKLRFPKATLRTAGVQFDHVVCVRVTGNSMSPVLPHGSIVAVDRGATSVVDGKVYAISQDGQLRIKSLYRAPNGGLRVRSFNHAEHPDESYSRSEIEEYSIEVLGRVFWAEMFM
ncbi:XRE family transcriptional regulator [Metapseudomonas otitidis]|uniref:XRE family transcriptional regulator n=1 Tax=Metapseudomonas otitidis TaxID=319939 RepID=UPI001F17BE00|nr:helix-turn-helix transcriptional regulator [Pseudomonas otitidis]